MNNDGRHRQTVAQICNLPHRRLPIGKVSASSSAIAAPGTLPNAILRHGLQSLRYAATS
jgi:hypothetical protein